MLEAEITGGLEHPGIVPCTGSGTYADGRPFYAMRFIRGDSLKEAIEHFHADGDPNRMPRADGRWQLRKLLRRFIDVCNAIDYAHSRGILHRDIKPGNIMVGKYGETLVVDWGLAKAVGKPSPARRLRAAIDAEPRQRQSSKRCRVRPSERRRYMSPEQARASSTDWARGRDVYSLGATLYCLLTGGRRSGRRHRRRCSARCSGASFRRPGPRPVDRSCTRGHLPEGDGARPADRYASAGRGRGHRARGWPTRR